MELSPFQSKILQAVEKRIRAKKKKGLFVEALAGAGKSTMVWLICQQLLRSWLHPQGSCRGGVWQEEQRGLATLD